MANPSDKSDVEPLSSRATGFIPDAGPAHGAALAEPHDAASPEMVIAAIRALDTTQLVKLERFAFYRMSAMGQRSGGHDGGDLLRESISVTLSGARRWRVCTVDFFGHLVGVMRSISSHWAEKAATESAFIDEKWHSGSDSVPDATAQIGARQELANIELRFRDDAQVTQLLHGFREGLVGARNREFTRLSRAAYDAALKRLRRAANALAKDSDRV